MRELQACAGIAARALEFVILTAARTGDIIGSDRKDTPPMRWEHVDLEARVWTIPHTKKIDNHRVPLSNPAMMILKNLKPDLESGGLVFPGTTINEPLSDGSMLRVLDRMVGRGDLTVHGFRASFKTWAGECTDFSKDVVEASLAHVVSD
jgi:integrase